MFEGGVFIKKLFQLVIAIFVLSFVVFYMSRLAPGEPLKSYYGEAVERMSDEKQYEAKEKLGLNQPIYKQYGIWAKNAFKGDFGISYKYKTDVMSVIKGVFMNTIILGLTSYILTFIFCTLLGIFCAINEGEFIDKLVCTLGNILNSIPVFWIALVLILIFSVNLKILPSSGAYAIGMEGNLISRIKHLILPIVIMILGHLWYYAYMIRNKLLEEIREDYVLLARIKGVKNKKIVYTHCLKNILPSLITIMAISVPHILGGTYIVEKIFSYPGLGTLTFESAKYHDYNMLMVLCLITGVVIIISNLIAEFINNKIDPRTKQYRGEYFELSKE
ncbi:MAG: ABC transporter permease [Sarcina sp.]